MTQLDLTPGQALKLWHEVAMGLVHGENRDLNLRQLAILLTIYLETPPHTVRGLAKQLNVTKPVITRALDSMGQHKLVERRPDERDRRSIVIRRTVEGALYLEQLADLIVNKAHEQNRHV